MKTKADTDTWSILLISPLPEFVNALLRHDYALTIADGPLAPEALRGRSIGHRVILTSVDAPLRREHLEAIDSGVRAIATYSVGLDHLDVECARERGLAVFNTPDVLTDSVAEIALLHLLAVFRRASESTALIRSGTWSGWTPGQLLGRELSGKRLGIFGMGRIGRAVARRACAFGMSIHYHNRRRLSADLEDGATFHPSVEQLFGSSDVLLLSAPSGPETRGILNRERIRRLPRGAAVINIARGDLVDDDALIEALETGYLSGAGLDVFRNEPRFDPRYLRLPNVFLTPHIGSSTVEARLRMAQALVDGLREWRAGGAPANRVV